MAKGKHRRIAALKALNGLIDIEITGLRQEQRQADERVQVLEEGLSLMDSEISDAEHRARSALDPGANLVIEEYQMTLAYLDQKKRLRVNKERQQGFAQERLKKIEGKLTQQCLKSRGVENLLERRLNEQRLEIENKQRSLLDEAWLLNQERKHDKD
ncbi:MAG: hypothetical protein P8179_09385 [Candidatus Thiodiazotropha sp.]|jgi:hypothetical protein